MKSLFDRVSVDCSKLITRSYTTSFSLGIYFLNKRFHDPIYGVYGFVRLADEIVDTFHGYDKEQLLSEFRKDTYKAIEDKISLNPVLNAFQKVVHEYKLERELIDTFLHSMEMDLHFDKHDRLTYKEYILGSAEVVGLMCLRVFTEGDEQLYEQLKPSAMKLGAAFQKVNFLRDLQADYLQLGRSYFPDIELNNFGTDQKRKIEQEIEDDFTEALEGIKRLPAGSKLGVYLAYVYFYTLLKKIKQTPSEQILSERIRISNKRKVGLLFNSYIRNSLNIH